MQYHHGAESLRQRNDVRIAQVGANLRQVGAFKGARMQINQCIAMRDDFVEQGVRDPGRGTAIRVAGEVAIQVATVRQVA